MYFITQKKYEKFVGLSTLFLLFLAFCDFGIDRLDEQSVDYMNHLIEGDILLDKNMERFCTKLGEAQKFELRGDNSQGDECGVVAAGWDEAKKCFEWYSYDKMNSSEKATKTVNFITTGRPSGEFMGLTRPVLSVLRWISLAGAIFFMVLALWKGFTWDDLKNKFQKDKNKEQI